MKRKHVIAVIIILLLAVAVIVGIKVGKPFSKKTSENGGTTEQSNEQLPKVNAYYGDEKIATIKGYRTEMEGRYLRDNIVPVNTDRTIPVRLKAKGNTVKNIKYEVRSTEDNRLIDNGEVTDWSGDNQISFDISISTIVESGTEYQLLIDIATEQIEDVYYYTRVMVVDKDFVTGQIEFAKKFSGATLGDKTDLTLSSYMETDDSLANDNLGQITLRSSFALLKWNELGPKLDSDKVVSAKEFCIRDNGVAGTYTIEYQVKANNSNKVEEKYNVIETIVVWSFNNTYYVLSYDREVNQIWTADEQNIGNSFIDLGIQSQTDIDVEESNNGQYISYSINGDVYLMDTNNKEITQLFALNASSSSDTKYTKSKVVSISDKGNTEFLVYGYSVSDEHNGKNGISVFDYNKEKNTSREIVFIPYSQPAEMIEKEIDELCYVRDGAVYFMVDRDLYYVNFSTKECGTVVSGLTKGSYYMNQKGTAIAYNTDLTGFNSDSITIIDFTTGKEHVIKAENGQKVSALGYTGENFIYGITNADSVREDKEQFNTLRIVDKNFNEITTYQKDGIMISKVDITSSLINIKRTKNGKAIADDQLIDNTVKEKTTAKVSYYADTLKLHEQVIAFNTPLTGNESTKISNAAKVVYDASTELKSTINPNVQNKLYLYANAKLQGIYEDRNLAETDAKTLRGLVVDENGQKIWTFEENYK